MRLLRILAALMTIAGAALLAYAISSGEMQLALVLILPVIYGSSLLGILAIGLIVVGVFLALAAPFIGAEMEDSKEDASEMKGESTTRRHTEFGGVVLIGPIPILFGSNRRMTIVVAIIAAIILAILLLSLFFSR